MAARVLVEDALQLVGSLLDVLLPLRLEELEALDGDDLWILVLQVLGSSDALVEGCVLNLASNGDFNGSLVLGSCHFLDWWRLHSLNLI